MPSPFPGMDPFIESQEWDDFHHAAIVTAAELMRNDLPDSFGILLERRSSAGSSLRRMTHRLQRHVIPVGPAMCFNGTASTVSHKVSVISGQRADWEAESGRPRVRLTLRTFPDRELVTVIEMLAPEDKCVESAARDAYLRERNRILRSRVGFVEIDLLRGGEKVPVKITNPPPLGYDYSALQRRGTSKRGMCLIAWPLSENLPSIPIPLAEEHDVSLDLQAVLDTVYDRARYGRTLNYSAPLVPPADAETQTWIDRVLGDRKPSSSQ